MKQDIKYFGNQVKVIFNETEKKNKLLYEQIAENNRLSKSNINLINLEFAAYIKNIVKKTIKYWQAVPYFYVWSHRQCELDSKLLDLNFNQKLIQPGCISSEIFINLNDGELYLQKRKKLVLCSVSDLIDKEFRYWDLSNNEDFEEMSSPVDGESYLMELYRFRSNINVNWRQKILRDYKVETPTNILMLL